MKLYCHGLDKFKPSNINIAEIIDFHVIPGKILSHLTDLYNGLRQCYKETLLVNLGFSWLIW